MPRDELELDVLELEDLAVLLHESIARLGENFDERIRFEVVDCADDRHTADELGDQAEFGEILGLDVAEDCTKVLVFRAADIRTETNALRANSILHDLLNAGEGAATDEQHVGGVDLQELLMRVLAATLGRHGSRRALEDLEQGLLHAFARHVTRDRRVFALAGDLVDLVDVDDAGLRFLDVVVGGLNQLQQDVLDIFADIAGLGEGGGVGDRKRHIEHAGEGLGHQGLAAACRADQQDVGLRQLDLAIEAVPQLNALVVVVDRNGQDPLRLILSDDVVVQEGDRSREAMAAHRAKCRRCRRVLLR